MRLRKIASALFILGLGCVVGRSQAPQVALPPTTQSDVPYGNHPRQVLDFWQAKSARPAPLVFFIHGGGWMGGDKTKVGQIAPLETFLDAGISVVSINYRYVSQAMEAGVQPPVSWPVG